RLVEELRPVRDLSRNPLFQIMFALQNTPDSGAMAEIDVSAQELDNYSSRFDLELQLWEAHAGLNGTVTFNTDLFDESSVRRLCRHYETMLHAILAEPHTPVGHLSMVKKAEQEQMLFAWNSGRSEFLNTGRLGHDLFTTQAGRTPDSTAVVHNDRNISYAVLNALMNGIAYRLRRSQLDIECRVGVCLRRTENLIAVLLGVLKAGCAYVPLDPAYPSERMSYIAADCGVSALITEPDLAVNINAGDANLIFIDELI